MKNCEIKKLKKMFLGILRDNNGRWSWELHGLDHKMKISREKILHIAHLLEDDGMTMIKGMEVPGQGIYEITSKGYDFLNSFKKAWMIFVYYISPAIVIILTVLQIIEEIKKRF